MTLEEIKKHYPNAVDIIIANEDPICVVVWEALRAINADVDWVVREQKATATTAVAVIPEGIFAGRLHQFDTDDYRRYVAAKLGMM